MLHHSEHTQARIGMTAILAFGVSASAATLAESPRSIPVAAQTDIVVVGGSSAAVAAAVAAARTGVRVFLAAPRPYLGEDLCATLRLGLEAEEVPEDALARQLFDGETAAQAMRPSVPFAYAAVPPSVAPHRDVPGAPRLTDGVWKDAARDSVEFDDDPVLTLDCARAIDVEKVTLVAFRRGGSFAVASMAVESSVDGQAWQPLETADAAAGATHPGTDVLSATVGRSARFLRLRPRRAAEHPRMLLGEILVTSTSAMQETAPHAPARRPPTPLHVKRTLDGALLEAGVPFVFGSYPTDVLRDASGAIAGVVIANRAGRQAIQAKVVVDASERATVARLAGAAFLPYPSGPQVFRRVVLGGAGSADGDASAQPFALASGADGGARPAYEFTLRLPLEGGGWAAFARAEQLARDATWHADAVAAAETLFQVPPDAAVARCEPPATWPGADKLSLDVARPTAVDRLWLTGGCGGVAREHAGLLLRPLAQLTWGTRLGEAAAAEALGLPEPAGVHLPSTEQLATAPGDTAEPLRGLRATGAAGPGLPAGRRLLPILGPYDVVVVGGGTAGAPAAIGAARQGATTLVIEYLHELGGVSTAGLIGRYYHGNRVGFTKEIDKGVAALGAEVGVLGKSEYYRQTLRKEGAEVWFGVLAVGAWVEDACVRGVVVATPHGRYAVAARVVVDATGHADIAAAAGAATTFVSGEHVAMQGTGLPPVRLGASYTNTDYTFVDDSDMLDLWRLFVTGRQRAGRAFDLGQLPDTRERRRIVGETVLTPLDILNQRTWSDTICVAKSDFDSHGYTVHPVFLLEPPSRDGRSLTAHIPYRALIPQGLEGVLVAGLGISAHRDAMPILRMQPDVQNQGYAAGVAAAQAARYTGGAVRKVDVRALQRHLVDLGNIPEAVLRQSDAPALPRERLLQAVAEAPRGGLRTMAALLSDPEAALPLLRDAYRQADSEAGRLAYARTLGILGDDTGFDTLLEAVRVAAWDQGWNFRGMGQYGASLSPLDSRIIALGRMRRREALPVLVEKARALPAAPAFSHCRAIAMAFESLRDPAAAGPLAELLNRDGMSGHALATVDAAENRNAALRELVLARALYRCGDAEGLGERILRTYVADLRGVLSRHADAVLSADH